MHKYLQYIIKHKVYLLNVGATFFSQFANAITLIILTPVLTKQLGLKEFGIYGVVINVISFSVILDFGLNIGLVRSFIHKLPKTNQLLNTLVVFFSTLLILLFPCYYIFYHNYFTKETTAIVEIATFTTIIVVQNIFAVYFDALIQSQNKIFISKIIRAIKLIIEFFLIIIFLEHISLIIILFIISLVNMFYLSALFIYLKKSIHLKLNILDIDLFALVNHFKYSIWYFISSIATVMVFNTQIVILNYFIGPEIAAKYLVIVRFFDIIRLAATNFTQVLFPKIIQAEVNLKWNEIKAMFLSLLKRITFMSILIFLFFWTLGLSVFIYWIGFKDDQILSLYHLYLIFTCLIIIDNVSVVFLSALKFNKIPTIVSIAQGIIGIVLSIILLRYLGYTGLLIGFLASFLITNLFFNPLFLIYTINKKII